MNKIFYFGFAALMMLAVVGTAAAVDGATDTTTVNYGCQGQGPNFVDTDNDDVCDNFVDEDGDGINDNRANNGAGKGNGACDGTGPRNGGAGAGGQYRNNR